MYTEKCLQAGCENMKKDWDTVFPYNIGKIPFYYTDLDNPHNPEGIPDFLDFNIDFDRITGTLTQKYDDNIQSLLNKAYSNGSQITGYMDDYEFGEKYTKDFLDFIIKNEGDIKGCSVLEIGCGTGFLLSLLENMGASVTGIEPGKQAEKGIKKYKINIINDYYPSENIDKKYDIIIFYNVLEHISCIEPFLSSVKKQLKANARIYFAVPDCGKAIECSDISMLIHEHYNYFTSDTLENTFAEYANLKADISKSDFGSELYGIAVNDGIYHGHTADINEIMYMNGNYIKNADHKIIIFKKFLNEIDKDGKALGIYVPSRALNMLSLIKEDIDLEKIDFFDDNPNLSGRYFPGFNKVIKCRSDLMNNPADYVLIMSYTFGDSIRNDLKKCLDNKTVIIKYEELV